MGTPARKDARRSWRHWVRSQKARLQEHMRGALVELRQWGRHDGDTSSPGSCVSAMDTDLDEVVTARRPALQIRVGGVRLRRSSSQLRKSCCCASRARKQSWSDRTWQFETVNITSGSRPQGRLEETAADVVLFQDRWTASRTPEQRSRSRKKRWDVTLSPAQREV